MAKKIKIALADKGRDYRALLTDLLQNENDFDVCCSTGDGNVAFEAITAERPDVLITDVILSGLDGLSLIQKLNTLKEADRPEIVVVSGFSSERTLSEAGSLGAAFVMAKPCDLDTLGKRIRQLAQSRRTPPKPRAAQSAKSIPQERSRSLIAVVTDAIQEIGIPAHIKGYQYIREAIMLVIEDMDVINSVTKVMYPTVAQKFSTTSKRVERLMRHAIDAAWDRGDIEVLQRFFGYTISTSRGKPTNSEFIAMVADRLRIDLREQI